MKKYLKLQAKKSLSLFLAVLMLLSCWVWVAPQAEAANDQHSGYYKVRVAGYVQDTMDDTSSTWTISFQDGTTKALAGKDFSSTIGSADNPAALTDEIWTNSFPTSVALSIVVTCGDRGEGRIEDNALQVYDFINNKWVDLHTWQEYNCAKNSTTSFTFNVDGGKYPAANRYTKSDSTTAITDANATTETLKIPDINTNTTVSATFTKYVVRDQYGVVMPSVEVNYYLANSAGDEDQRSQEEFGVWLDGTTVKADNTMQQKLPIKTGESPADIYLYCERGKDTNLKVGQIKFTYPTYTLKVDHIGSLKDTTGTTMDITGGSTLSSALSETNYYGNALTKIPTGTASKTGYTFKGFWTTKQPTSGAGDYNALEADFAEPTDSETFATYAKTAGSVTSENGLVVTTAEGAKYYNAGRQFDSKTDATIVDNIEFYGWWISKDITVNFYDIDGSYLGTEKIKNGLKGDDNFYPDPKKEYTAGAFTYSGFNGEWRDITGKVINESTYTFGDMETLTLTPVYSNKAYDDKYNIVFNSITGAELSKKEYSYRHILGGAEIPTITIPGTHALATDAGYTYRFSGWTTQKPTGDAKYIVVAEGDTSFKENTDWVVRSDATYYPVFRSSVKEYLVDFIYTDSTGTQTTETKTVAYGSTISTPANVNRTYAKAGYEYTLKSWDYLKDANGEYGNLGVDGILLLDTENLYIAANSHVGGSNQTAIMLEAVYGDKTPTPYKVTFKYKDENGADKTITANVNHDEYITADTVAELVATVPAEYDDGSALYKFANNWIVTEGLADKAEYTEDEFTSFSPVSHVTFEAVYGEGTPFYTVTYIDGANAFTKRVLKGLNVPGWVVNEAEYIPVKEDAATGEYTFVGWFDAKQTDKDFAQTNGNQYTSENIVDGDIVLYPQFKFSAFKYTITFWNFDRTVQLANAEVEAGNSFEAAFIEARMAAQYRAPSDTYTYQFIGWDYDPGNCICQGKDMEYTALYKTEYRYYNASWYNSVLVGDKWVANGEAVATTKHTYNSALYIPSVNLVAPDAGAGYTYVFAGWKYIKDGVEGDFVRGMKITGDMSFFATYKRDAVPMTVTTVVGETSTEYNVTYNTTAADIIGDPADGYVDAEKHNKFIGWYTDADYTTKFDLAKTAITSDITIYAKFEDSAHDKSFSEHISDPTYYVEGSKKIWCACDKAETIETVAIPMLTDTVAPTGTIHLGTLGSWSSTDEVGAAATDNDDVAYYVNANTDIILVIKDTGDVDNNFNPAGTGKGIQIIQGIISNGVFGSDTTTIAGIQTIFQAEEGDETLNNTATYVTRLRDYKGLVDGETYIAYYYVKDKAGNVLNTKVRTAKFVYDVTAPEFDIESNCLTATIKNIEDGATVTVNGEATTDYTITKAGEYTITVTDRAGNSTTKTVTIEGKHNIAITEQAATCTVDGYVTEACTRCDYEKTTTVEQTGHSYGAEVVVAPTCEEAGYTVKTCSACNDEVKTDVRPAARHEYNEENGEIKYNVVTVATCKADGKAVANCTVCGKGTLTKVLPQDENAHTYGPTKTLKATCTEEGAKYYNCKLCFAKVVTETTPALNHEGTGTYTAITTAPTCHTTGVETTYCKGCDEALDTAEVAATGRHVLKFVTHNEAAEGYPNGYVQYECQVEGCDYVEGTQAITVKAEYTVTFQGAGENGADVTITKTEGESISAAEVYTKDEYYRDILPTKESTAEYNYTFAGWKADGDAIVDLPVVVTKNVTYTAEFTATKRTYTHIFKVPTSVASTVSSEDDYKVVAKITGNFNDEGKMPSKDPVMAPTAAATYTFTGWQNVETNEMMSADYKMTGNATFIAVFASTPVQYKVTYLNGTDALGFVWYDYGTKLAAYDVTPAKDYDDQYHYTFSGWSVAENTVVTTDLYVQAQFKKTAHSYDDGVVTKPATCAESGEKLFTCTCGKTKIESIAISKKHTMVDGVCTVCGHEEKEANVTIIFKHENGSRLYTTSVKKGATVTYDVVPTKASDDQYNYEFAGWVINSTDEASMATEFVVNEDVVYTAKFTAKARTFTVTYYNVGKPVLQKTGVVYGANLEVINGNYAKDADDGYHYVFLGWSVNNGPAMEAKDLANVIVTGNTVVNAEYQTVSHDWSDKIPSTCVVAEHQKCNVCGYKYTTGTITNNHEYDGEPIIVEAPTFDKEGTLKYECTECGETITEKIAKKPYYIINIKVYDDNGNAAEYANVKLYNGENLYTEIDTDKEGFVSIKVDRDLDRNNWKVAIVSPGYIAGGAGGKVETTSKEVGGFVNVFNEPDEEEPVVPDTPAEEPEEDNCGQCKCHKSTFSAMIFRFFRKIIKLFTGKVCCPDADYF